MVVDSMGGVVPTAPSWVSPGKPPVRWIVEPGIELPRSRGLNGAFCVEIKSRTPRETSVP